MANYNRTLQCPYCARGVSIRVSFEESAGTSETAGASTHDGVLPDVPYIPSSPDVAPRKRNYQDDDSPAVLDQACTNCHSRKKKCSPSLPCESCIKLGKPLECAYPPADQRFKRMKPAHSSRGPQGAHGLSWEMVALLPPPPSTVMRGASDAPTATDLGLGFSTQYPLDMGEAIAAHIPQPPQFLFPPPSSFDPSFTGPSPLSHHETPATNYSFPFLENQWEAAHGDRGGASF